MRRLLVVCLILAASHPPLFAQQGLVLSGGGSRGLAHAGVLIGLERLGHDPVLVVGTSMGAVVGALYAAGYEPEEIRRRILAVRWDALFEPTPVMVGPERSVRHPMLMVDRGDTGFRGSRGIVGQWRINRELARLLFDANARSRGDFDHLPRRYRAVAADLKTGEAVVLGSGDLARAARASMAVPGLFAPVEWDGRILIDGSIADKLPTSVARRLGARSIIASDVGRPPDEIHSLAPLAVVSRALDLMSNNAQRDTLPPDVLVLPPLDPALSGAAFPRDPTPLIDAGLVAALRDLQPAQPGARRTGPPAAQPDSFAGIVIDAPSTALAALARRAFADAVHVPYDPTRVLDGMDVLYSTGLFEGVWPTVLDSTGSATPWLVVRLEGLPQISLVAAGGYDTDRGGRVWVALDRSSALYGRPAVLTASASAGGIDRWAALSGRVYSLARPGVAGSVGAHARERAVRSFEDDLKRTSEVLRAGGWLALEFPQILRRRSAVATARVEWINDENGARGVSIGPALRYGDVESDTRVVGVPLLLEAETRWGTIAYSRLAVGASHTFGQRSLTVAPLVDIRATSPDTPPDVQPALGDDHIIPGLRWGEQRGSARVVLGIDAAHPLAIGTIRMRLRSGAATQGIDDWRRAHWITGVEIGALWHSAIGTIEVGYGRATRGDGRFDVNLGRTF